MNKHLKLAGIALIGILSSETALSQEADTTVSQTVADVEALCMRDIRESIYDDPEYEYLIGEEYNKLSRSDKLICDINQKIGETRDVQGFFEYYVITSGYGFTSTQDDAPHSLDAKLQPYLREAAHIIREFNTYIGQLESDLERATHYEEFTITQEPEIVTQIREVYES